MRRKNVKVCAAKDEIFWLWVISLSPGPRELSPTFPIMQSTILDHDSQTSLPCLRALSWMKPKLRLIFLIFFAFLSDSASIISHTSCCYLDALTVILSTSFVLRLTNLCSSVEMTVFEALLCYLKLRQMKTKSFSYLCSAVQADVFMKALWDIKSVLFLQINTNRILKLDMKLVIICLFLKPCINLPT